MKLTDYIRSKLPVMGLLMQTGKTQKELATAMGISQSVVSEQKNPTIKWLNRAANSLGYQLHIFYTKTGLTHSGVWFSADNSATQFVSLPAPN